MTFLRNSVFHFLLGIFAVWALVFQNTILSTVAIWYRSETFAHCFIILPICIYLIRLKWSTLNNATFESSWVALVFVLGTLFLWLFASMAEIQVAEQFAAFAILPLMIWCILGNHVARILLFPSFFWLFSVPFGEFLVPQLQELTADITVIAIELTGIPVYREGLYIAIPKGLFEVAVACSGIRYLIASFTLGTLFAYLNYRSLKKRTIFVLFSVVLPLLANGIRAYGIVMIAHLSDMKYATGVDHLVYGWLFFGVVIFIMFTVGGRWADPISKEDKIMQPRGPIFQLGVVYKPLVVLCAMIVAASVYKATYENPVSSHRPDMTSVYNDAQPLSSTSWLPVFEGATQTQYGSDGTFDYFYAYYDSNQKEKELINARNTLYNIDKWSIVTLDSYNTHQVLQVIDSRGQKRFIAFTYVTAWRMSPKIIEIKLLQAFQALLGLPQNGFVLAVSLPITDSGESLSILNDRINTLFTDALRDRLDD